MTADPNQLKNVKEIGRQGTLFCLARMPNSGRLFYGCSDFKTYEIDIASEKQESVPLASHTSYVSGIALVGNQLVSGGWDGQLIWWDIDTHEQLRAVAAHQKWIRGVVASPDGTWIASVADDMVCRRWDASTGELIAELRGHDVLTPQTYPSMLFAVTISNDGQYIATADKQGKVIIWEVATSKEVARVEAKEMYTWDPNQRRHSIGGARSVAFSPDGSLVAVGGMGQVGNIDHLEGKTRIEIFDWRKNERTHEFIGNNFKGLIESVQFHPNGKWLLASGGDGGGVITVLDLANKAVLKEEKISTHVHAVVPDEKWETIYCVGHGKLTICEMKAIEGTPPEPSDEMAKS
jgi:WD40 repeat protein